MKPLLDITSWKQCENLLPVKNNLTKSLSEIVPAINDFMKQP